MTGTPDVGHEPAPAAGPIRALRFAAAGLGLSGALMLLAMFASNTMASTDNRPTVMALILATLLMMTLAVGLWRARRWARVVGHALALALLVGGISILPFILLSIPSSPATGSVIESSVFGLLVVALVAFPAFWVLLLRRPDLRAAIERMDPGPSWTDRWSSSMWGLLGTLLAGAATSAAAGWNLDGLLADGLPSRVCGIAVGVMYAASALGMWRGMRWGWWLALICVLSLPLVRLIVLVAGRMPVMPAIPGVEDPTASPFAWPYLRVHLATVFVSLPLVVWLLLVRRHMAPNAAPSAPEVTPSPH